jgi:hypothetical protein
MQSFLCLDEQHRLFLVALHVFPGSFTSRAASAVIKSRLSLTEDALHELTEHSMLHVRLSFYFSLPILLF